MSKRKQDSSAESLAEALSRVMVPREELDHHRDNYDWATQEGRGDRMPRFLERAIQEVPHASRAVHRSGAPLRYQGRSRFRRVSFIMSLMGIGAGVAVSVANPERVGPLVEKAQLITRLATANFSFTSSAVAATPRLRFGEALRNYSEEAAAQAARANIVVSNLTPGATLSAGAQVSDTEWSLPQSDLENLVITFPRSTPEDAMHATVEIPGNSKASSGKFSVELRRADDGHEAAAIDPASAPESGVQAEPAEAAAVAAPVKNEAAEAEEPVRKATHKARSSDAKVAKRKPRPSAALPVKSQPTTVGASDQKTATASKTPAGATTASAGQQMARAAENNGESSPSIFGLFSSFASNGLSPNALTLNSLGGPMAE